MNSIGTAEKISLLTMIISKINRHAREQQLDSQSAGVSSLQHGILQILSISTHTSSELSRMMMLDPSTLVPVVDSLEQKGLIQRSIDPKDRRRTPLVLTEQGIEALRRIAKSSEADPLMTSLQMLGQENAEQLLALLTDVLRHMPDGEAILARLDQAEKGE